jgi:hypothetical protein
MKKEEEEEKMCKWDKKYDRNISSSASSRCRVFVQ